MAKSPLPKKEKKAEVQMTFSQALHAVLAHKKVTRLDWNNPQEYLLMQDNFLRIHKEGLIHNLIVSEGDMLGIDWVIV